MSLLNIAGSIHTKQSLLESIRQSVPTDGRKVHTMGPWFPHPRCIRKGVICVLCRGQWAKKVVHRNRPRQDTAPETSPSHLLQWPWLAIYLLLIILLYYKSIKRPNLSICQSTYDLMVYENVLRDTPRGISIQASWHSRVIVLDCFSNTVIKTVS